MSISTKIVLSQPESNVLGLKIGRCNAENLNVEVLLNQIIKEKFDLCRLKIPSEYEEISLKLKKTKLPFFFSGSIRRYKTRIEKKPIGEFKNQSLIFEAYDGSQNDVFKTLLKDTWGSYPLGYYRTPFLCDLVNKENEIESVYQFYCSQNLVIGHPNNTIIFMKDREVYVGYFALNIINEVLESHIGGIVKEHQKDGYFLDMLRYIKNYCVDNDLKHFGFGARNENALVQSIFHKVGFTPIGNENVFHIVPLLNGTETQYIPNKTNIMDATQYIISTTLKKYNKHVLEELFINNVLINKTDFFTVIEKPIQNYFFFSIIIKDKFVGYFVIK